jgi:uncharacterized protein (DUF1697 family)
VPRYIALLRAINVGGRNVKMDQLRRVFAEMGFANVETFIASGNVIFDADSADTATLERTIEDGLKIALGYRVDTFIRTPEELAAIAGAWPFSDADRDTDHSFYVAFLAATPGGEARAGLLDHANDVDAFHVDGRQVYWLRRNALGESAFSGALLERALRAPATLRNVTTVRKLAAKYS